MDDDLKALAQRCVPDPTLERFFRDEERKRARRAGRRFI